MSPDQFKLKIKESLSKPTLQEALDNNFERRKTASRKAFESLLDAPGQRLKARAIRAKVIDNLDNYIEQFINQAQQNGFRIHRAKDASEAVKVILKIAEENDAGLMVKSKTMVSEEIELNSALQEAGIRVMETDLGEFIVQLRGERPGHILTPAVHLRRGDVAQTFKDKLDVPYTEDVAELTQFARQALRKEFLEADIGLSGVNFGIAENGMLCVLTNEGNGRMVTTVPRIHIALMGMERLVPNMADLATLVSVLPRASSGQKITVYTNLIRGPRGSDEPDGPSERHLVILDNGRSALRSSPLKEALYCIRCGACLNICPVFREIGGHAYVGKDGQASVYSGPIGSVIGPGLFGTKDFGKLARASTLCGACRDTCPVGIDLPGLLLKVRAGQTADPQPPNAPKLLAGGLRLYAWAASSGGRFKLIQKLAGFLGKLTPQRNGWIRFPSFTGWGFSKDFPQPAGETFHDRYKKRTKASPTSEFPKHNLPAKEINENAILKDSHTRVGNLVDLFEDEFVSLGGEFVRCTSDQLADRIAAKVESIQSSQSVKRSAVWAWGASQFPIDLLSLLTDKNLVISHRFDDEITVGLTGAVAGVAETGSVVLPGGLDRPLSASLLPENHLVVLQQDQIIHSLSDALQLPVLQSVSASAFVTGPSRTGDIELTLTVGVHGPKRVIIFCVIDQ